MGEDLVDRLRKIADRVELYEIHMSKSELLEVVDRIKELEMQVEELHARIDVLER